MAAIPVATTVAATLGANTTSLFTLPAGARSVVVQNITGSPASVFVGFAGTDGGGDALVAAYEVAIAAGGQFPLPRLKTHDAYLRSTGAATVVVGWSRSDSYAYADLTST